MLSGRVPAQGDPPAAILVQQISQASTPLHTLMPNLPRPLSEVVHRALAKEPPQRFGSCRAFYNEPYYYDPWWRR